MSETTMREAVLWEFTYDAGLHRLCRVADMADEIRRLRDENTALSGEINRLTRILGELLEPSEVVMRQIRETWLNAAVAAAEQEVGRDIR